MTAEVNLVKLQSFLGNWNGPAKLTACFVVGLAVSFLMLLTVATKESFAWSVKISEDVLTIDAADGETNDFVIENDSIGGKDRFVITDRAANEFSGVEGEEVGDDWKTYRSVSR